MLKVILIWLIYKNICCELSNLSDIIRLLVGFGDPHVEEPEKCCNNPYIIKKTNENLVVEHPLVEFHHIEHNQRN